MLCPKCKSWQVTVIDSRSEQEKVVRRRECQNCGHRFSTHEITVEKHRELSGKIFALQTRLKEIRDFVGKESI